MHTVIFSHKAHRKKTIENADKYQRVVNNSKKRQITPLYNTTTHYICKNVCYTGYSNNTIFVLKF